MYPTVMWPLLHLSCLEKALAESSRSLITTYEQMHMDTPETMKKSLRFRGIEKIHHDSLMKAIEFSFPRPITYASSRKMIFF